MKTKLFDIANYIIERCPNITNMKLQKLVYYAHAQFLVNTNGQPLIDEVIEAWIYGPVIRPLYEEFAKHSYKNIEKSCLGDASRLSDVEKLAISKVIDMYGKMSASDLSDKTHCEDPWQDAYKSGDWSENIITNDSLLQYYKNHLLS